MDQNKKKINQILSPFSQLHSSKKAIKFIFSISLLGILFSYSSLLSTFYMNLFNFYTYSSDKNYIFLLCNGILVLIIKNSGLFAISPANSDHFTNKKNTESHQYTGYRDQINVNKNSQLNGYSASAVEVDKTERMVITYTDEVVENMELVSSNEEKEQKEKEVDDPLKFVEDEEQEVNEVCNVVAVEKQCVEIDRVEEEEGIELLSTEELNKKFDDFIKKMKDGIKFEAQQHHRHNLVMV